MNKHMYTTEENEWLISYDGRNKDISNEFLKSFGHHVSCSALSHKKARLVRGEDDIVLHRCTWTREMEEYLRKNIHGVPYAETAKRMNEVFGTTLNQSAIAHRAHMLGISNGIDGRFKKGSEAGKAYRYRKGNIPYTKVDVGSVTYKNGKKYIKVSETGDQAEDWVMYDRYMYEKETGVKLGKWDTVIFLDGDTENFSPDNMRVTKAGLYTGMKRRGELTDVPELTKAYLALSLLRHEANKKQQ